MINYCTEGVDMPTFDKTAKLNWIKRVADAYGKKLGEITYIFCNDAKILEVNKQYLQHDYYTDIITFDYTEGKKIGGDLFISLDTVRSNAEEYGVAFLEELDRIIIHGILHLCGVEDQSEEQRANMISKENEALKMR